MTPPVRILIVDDHAAVRDAIADRLGREPGFILAGRAGSAEEAVAKVGRCAPDVVLMDIDMPGLDCFSAARTIAAKRPSARIVFLSGFVQDSYIDQALAVKARGYVIKAEPLEVVVSAVREVAGGGSYFSPQVRRRIVIDSHGAKLAATKQSRASTLTRREREVLGYLVKGSSKTKIAEVMHLSPKTVDHHITRIRNKLDIHKSADLVRFAIREGLVRP